MPLDRGIIDQQLQALGEGSEWWERRELRDLPAVLHADERILAIARGKVGRIRLLRRTWLIVVTDTRLVCLKSHGRSWRQIEVDLDQITRVSLRIGPFRGRVRVTMGNQTMRLLVRRSSAYRLHSELLSVVRPAEPARGFGPARVVRRVMDHMMALPAAALHPEEQQRPRLQALPPAAPQNDISAEYVQQLETEIEQLRQQVDFLEQLVRDRQPVVE